MNIKQATYLISNPSYEKCPVADRPEYAFIGRSNVGKSSLINMICNNNKLAKTSSAPGKTQMINHFGIISSDSEQNDRKWYLVDLPGYGFAKISQTSRRRWEQMIENYLRKRINLTHVFILVDARLTPQKLDLNFIQQLNQWQIPYTILFTKSDKEKQGVVATNVQLFLEALKQSQQFLPQYIITSAVKKTGREEILQLISEMNEEYK